MENLEDLKEKAIEAALKGKWPQAVKINQKIIHQAPDDLEAHLRLGFALWQMGNLDAAKMAYYKALKIQPGNQIATNNLERIKILKEKRYSISTKDRQKFQLDPNLFLDIPGKTRVVSLVNLGQINVLVKLRVGQEVFLRIKKRRIEIRNEKKEYIGALPDDLSKRLILFLKAKSRYRAFVKEAGKKNVEIFIKEEKRGRKVQHYPSFPKNLQEHIRILSGETEEELSEAEEEIDKEEGPLDLEELAEEVEEREYYHEPSLDEDREEFEE